MKINKTKITLIVILIIATALRVIALLRYGEFWGDELFSVIYSQKPWADSILKFWIWETNPPLHMFFLKIWFYIFPVNEFWARVPSLLFSLLGILCLYNFAKRLFSEKIALISATVMALSPDFLFYSVTARTYSLLILLTILSCDYFFRIFIEKKFSKKTIFLYCLFNLLLLFSHLTSLTVLFCQFILLVAANRKEIMKWLMLNLIPGSLWLIWAIPSLSNKLNMKTAGGAWFLNMPGKIISILKNFQLILTGPTHIYYGTLMMLLLILALIFAIYKQRKENNLNKSFLLITILGLTPILGALFLKLYNIRFFLISLPWITLISACLFYYFVKKTALIYVFIIMFLLPGLFNVFSAFPLNNWISVSNIIYNNSSPDKKQIIIYNDFNQKNEIDLYLKTSLPVVTYFPYQKVGWDYYFITQNYIFNNQSEKEISSWLENIKINDYNKIFLLYNPDRGIDILNALKKQDWQESGSHIKLKTVLDQDLIVLIK